VGVGFPRRVFVRGRGLDSQWEGDLKVGGRADSPIITGELSVVRGNLELLDKRFNLAKSSIQFFGSQPPSPKLNITAETNAGEILARLRITGDVSSPEISFESEPPLPEDEILSHVLFGRSMGDLTPLQSLRIANALRILSGKGPTTDIMGRMRNILGLDYLDIKQQNEEGATVGVGRYLAEGVYLNAEQSISGEGGTASLEVEVTPNITIESEVGTDSEAGIGVNWRFDY
jgi:translocation and assembly module TamB